MKQGICERNRKNEIRVRLIFPRKNWNKSVNSLRLSEMIIIALRLKYINLYPIWNSSSFYFSVREIKATFFFWGETKNMENCQLFMLTYCIALWDCKWNRRKQVIIMPTAMHSHTKNVYFSSKYASTWTGIISHQKERTHCDTNNLQCNARWMLVHKNDDAPCSSALKICWCVSRSTINTADHFSREKRKIRMHLRKTKTKENYETIQIQHFCGRKSFLVSPPSVFHANDGVHLRSFFWK